MIEYRALYACRFCENRVERVRTPLRIADWPQPYQAPEIPDGWHIVWNMLVCDRHKLVVDPKE